jgi:hypothetical protein
MRTKLTALNLSLVVVLAIGAIAAISASANTEGHFVTSGNSSATIHGEVTKASEGPHYIAFIIHGLEGEIGCDVQTYTATTSSETTTSLTFTPKYEKCYTTGGGEPGSIPIHVNGCTYTFRVAKGTTDSTEQTSQMLCPAGKKIEVTHPNCTMSIHPQSINTGTTYTTKVSTSGIHELTKHINIQFGVTRHGLCQFIAPTNGTCTLKGSLTLRARLFGIQIHLTAT